MEVYCVKEKRFTPNVAGSETFATTRNGKRLLKVKCASCGITKTRFVSVGLKEVIFWIQFLSGPEEVCPKRKETNLLPLKKDYSEAG